MNDRRPSVSVAVSGPKGNGASTNLEPSRESPLWGEQRGRYHFAARFVRKKSVLDVGCGGGSGSAILEDAGARSVIGTEAPWDIARGASIRDGAVDVVVCFETIEGARNDAALLAELSRIVSSDGVVFVSTQNLRPADFVALLQDHFRAIELRAQHPGPGYPRSSNGASSFNGKTALLRGRSSPLRNLVPYRWKDSWSRLLHNRAYFPGEYDFVFTQDDLENATALVATCWPHR